MEDFKLSTNFTYFELTKTEHRKYLDLNRIEGQDYVSNGYQLCRELLQPIRDFYNEPLVVHSGFRCSKLNRAIGGSSKSQHCLFEACDFHIVEIDLEDIFNGIRNMGLKWGQLILEGWSLGHPSWIHISLPGSRPPDKCQEVLTFDGKGYYRIA